MKIFGVLFSFLLAISLINCSTIVKRQAENELSPLNEVYIFETEDNVAADDDRSDRDKRKIGIVKLGVTNGIINFVFGKLDAFIDAKTKAISVLDESNKAKNAAYGIDNTQSATSQFISKLISQKIQASSASIGPVINSATTFLSSAKSGLSGALVSKIAPLSSLSNGLSSGSGSPGGSSSSAALGGILSSKISVLGSLSGSSSNLSGGSGTNEDEDESNSGSDDTSGIHLGVGEIPETTPEDISEFDRKKVSLDIPPALFGEGFNVITNISKVISNVILNSAHRTERILEILKPLFRGVFAIKGLPSDNPQQL